MPDNVIVYHHNDVDGRCAAAIVLRLARARGWKVKACVELDYKDSPDFSQVTKDDAVWIVDFSFKPDVMARLRSLAGRVVWCDHHKTAERYGYDDVEGVRDFEEKGLSGAECTWVKCYPVAQIPLVVEVVGDYDSWRMKRAPTCLHFRAGIEAFDSRPVEGVWTDLLDDDEDWAQATFEHVCADGAVVCRYQAREAEGLCAHTGYSTEIDGHRAFAVNTPRFGSLNFGARMQKFPICMAYQHDGRVFIVSLYSETIDVSAIAVAHGGGGHTGAAGFTCTELPFRRKEEA